MRQSFIHSAFVFFLTLTALPLQAANPLVGKWDFTVQTESGTKANWLSVEEKDGQLVVWFQPSGGHVIELKDVQSNGTHLNFTASAATATRPAMRWELQAVGNKLAGVQKSGDKSISLIGVRAPALDRNPPQAWSAAEPLFDGRDLNGWEPIGDTANNHWIVKDGVLFNEAHGANLRTVREFTDFKVHFEVNCPEKSNSGFYLRGRYELQLEYEPDATEPMERSMGSIYGRIPPNTQMPRRPGTWETFDVTLVGRTVTVSRNGVTIIDRKQIDGITGGALDAHEGLPGPFYIQGDHTGGLMFRNITVSVPKT